jgi:hypothetical protein
MTLVRALKISLAAILVAAAVPFVLTLGAGLVGAALGCQVDESGIHPCVVFGIDLGYPLYATALTGLIMLIGLPFAGVALLVWLVVAGVAMLRRRRRSARAFSGEVDTGSP